MSEAFEQVLQLVAQGKLSAEEAAPILEALERKPKGIPGRPAGCSGRADAAHATAVRCRSRAGSEYRPEPAVRAHRGPRAGPARRRPADPDLARAVRAVAGAGALQPADRRGRGRGHVRRPRPDPRRPGPRWRRRPDRPRIAQPGGTTCATKMPGWPSGSPATSRCAIASRRARTSKPPRQRGPSRRETAIRFGSAPARQSSRWASGLPGTRDTSVRPAARRRLAGQG